MGTALYAMALSCSSTTAEEEEEEPQRLQALGEECSPSVGCVSPSVCELGRCRTECDTSGDCDEALRCVRTERTSVCQFENEVGCDSDASCPGAQTCAVDDKCRDECADDDECVDRQFCVFGSCIAVDEWLEFLELWQLRDRVQSCDECAPPRVCARVGGAGLYGLYCVTRPPQCENDPSCACMKSFVCENIPTLYVCSEEPPGLQCHCPGC